MTELEKIVSSFPSEYPFTLPMAADSTNEVWVDIPTKLKHDEAWHLLGWRWNFEHIDSPTTPMYDIYSSTLNAKLQLLRSNSELLLSDNDPNVIASDELTVHLSVSGAIFVRTPFERSFQAVTTQQTLRAIFRTAIDQAGWSDPTIAIVGKLFYRLVKAPSDGRTKLGIPIDEI